jgi:hypothetical protein
MSQRILLITPEFYGLEKEIKKELEKFGYDVVWINNKVLTLDYHGPDSKFRLLRRIYFFFFFPNIRYTKRELDKIKDTRFDILFSINGHIISSYLFKKLKQKNPSLFSILYLWDAFSKYSWTKELKHFDKVYTFDKADSVKYGIEYKPNFFIGSNHENNKVQEFDLFFAGKFDPNRLSIVDNILSQADKSALKYFVKLWPAYKILPHNRLVYLLLKKIKFKNEWVKDYLLNFEAVEGILKRKFIIKERLSHIEMQPYLLGSNVILDMPYQGQTGYSHLLIEALANGKKLITTNSDIIKERFYNPEQIHILDKNSIESDLDWIREKRTFKIDSYFNDFELSSWLKSIINVGIA